MLVLAELLDASVAAGLDASLGAGVPVAAGAAAEAVLKACAVLGTGACTGALAVIAGRALVCCSLPLFRTYHVSPAAASSRPAATVPIRMPLRDLLAGTVATSSSLARILDPKGLVSASTAGGAVSARDSVTRAPPKGVSSFCRCSSFTAGSSATEAAAA